MKASKRMTRVCALFVVMVAGGLVLPVHHGAWAASLSQGQTVYVSVYSAVRIGDHGNPFPLAATLCIRNTDRTHAITVRSVDYYDSSGKLLKHYLDAPQRVAPMAAMDSFIRSSDMSGGLYPSFLVRWDSSAKVSEPVIEAIIVGDRSGQGISFISKGHVLEEGSKP